MVDLGRIGHLLWRMKRDHLAVRLVYVVLDARRRREQVQPELALEALLDDFHVQEPQETHAEAETQRMRRFGLPYERGIVERELLERLFQRFVLVALDGEQAGEHHGLNVAIAGQGLGRTPR